MTVSFNSGDFSAVTIFASHAGLDGQFDDFSLSAAEEGQSGTSKRVIPKSAGGYGLSPDLPPGRNFDLLDWNLNTPADDDNDGISDRFSEIVLANGAVDERYFYTVKDGGMVFRATIGGARTSANTQYTRTELREMLRRGDTSIGTKGEGGSPGANNWVFSSAPAETQKSAGAVDGTLRTTLAVNHVTTTGDNRDIGQVVIGQIHAGKDEPARLYCQKFPDSQRGKGRAQKTIDMSASGYDVANDYMYFKAGVYNQNKSGDPEDYVKATFYELENSHAGYDY